MSHSTHDTDLQTVMSRLEARINARSRCQAPKPRLPMPKATDPAPLFASGVPLQRDYLQSATLSLPGVGPLIYQGQQLAADDHAVWRALLRRAAHTQTDLLVFPSLGILRAMGWGQSRRDRLRLRQCLERLQAAWVRQPHGGTNLPLLLGCQWQTLPSGRSDRWRVRLSPAIHQLFAHWEALNPAQAA